MASSTKCEAMVNKHKGTQELRNAALILKSSKINLVSLQELCMRSIALNLPKFSAVPEWMSQLPIQLQSEILIFMQKLNSPVVDADTNRHQTSSKKSFPERLKVKLPLRVIQRLINPTLTEFDFALCPKKVCFFETNGVDFKLLETLASTQNVIRRIVDRRSHRKYLPSSCSHIVHLLTKFKNLQHLDMNTVKFSDGDVKVLSKSCLRLRSLTLASSSTLTTEALKSLSTLPSLESLVLGRTDKKHSKETRISFQNAINIIPRLKSVRSLEDEPWQGYRLEIPLNPECTYNLEELRHDLRGYYEKIPTILPNLKVVCIKNFYDEDEDSDDDEDIHYPAPEILNQLPLLTCLKFGFDVEDNHEYREYLSILGPKLTCLELKDCDLDDIDIFSILYLCPNLHSLKMKAYLKQDKQLEANKVDVKQLKLRELHLNFYEPSEYVFQPTASKSDQ
ncbi:uncharacterized protein LOC132200216 isoform X2 [Neocloeon triangulifer]|uniref:uncharacterized protein LOC132200216 isoform X2 n=1 Tax=Neocloeon triangulifer TaxID=2078957 RepID=UPI00286F8B8D|nr:uncharacterized protein LOC132200216 isoform X2 [Neocloeon triangulifer]